MSKYIDPEDREAETKLIRQAVVAYIRNRASIEVAKELAKPDVTLDILWVAEDDADECSAIVSLEDRAAVVASFVWNNGQLDPVAR